MAGGAKLSVLNRFLLLERTLLVIILRLSTTHQSSKKSKSRGSARYKEKWRARNRISDYARF